MDIVENPSFDVTCNSLAEHNPPTLLMDSVDEPPLKKHKAFGRKVVKKKTTHPLTYGYVRFKPGSTPAERKTIWQLKKAQEGQEVNDGKSTPQIIPDTWNFYNMNMSSPIQLYGRQVLTLIKHLTEAYEQLQMGNVGYICVIGESKTQRITLEVDVYNEEIYLYLKKAFKMDENDTEWIPIHRSNVSFHPEKDDPQELADFVLSCASE